LNAVPFWCKFDHCCSFEQTHPIHVYCKDHGCAAKAENTRRRALRTIAEQDEELWQLQESRKLARATTMAQKNQWILANKRIAMFDLETYDLAADFGIIFIGCIKTYGVDEVFKYVMKPGDPVTMDHQTILEIRDTLESYDYVCTYNGTKFDLPYLNTRLLIHGERPLAAIRHKDLYFTAKSHLRLGSKRLAAVEMALFGEGAKTAILPGYWAKALQGSKFHLDYILDHCVKDVEVLERVFTKLQGFINMASTPLKLYGAGYGLSF